jgi:hypothetical protein
MVGQTPVGLLPIQVPIPTIPSVFFFSFRAPVSKFRLNSHSYRSSAFLFVPFHLVLRRLSS